MTAAKSWISQADCQDAQDKQRTQYLLYTLVKMAKNSKLLKIPKSKCPDIGIRLPRHKWPKSWSSMEDPVVPLERNLYGHPLAGLLWARQFEKILLKHGWEKIPNWECIFVPRERDYSYMCMWMTLSWLERNKILIRLRISSWFLWHGWSCKEVCGTILWVGKQDDSATLQSIYSMHRWPPLQRRRNEICWRIVTSMLRNCSEMVKISPHWTTRYYMVSEQTCTIDHKMDQSMWQTIISFDLPHSSHKWRQTILSCGKHGKTMQIGTVPRLRFCRRCWGFRIYIRWNMVEKLQTVLELYNLEIHHKKAGPDYHRLKTMVKRSIEQNLRVKNFEARNGNFETSAVDENHRMKQREQRSPGECWQWKANGQCSKGDSCSFRHDMNECAKSTLSNTSPNSFMQQNERRASRTRSPRGRSPSVRMFRLLCKDYFKGTCTTPFCEKWHPPECLFYKSEIDVDLVKSALTHTARLTNSPARSLKRMVIKVQWLCWKLHDNWVAYLKIWSCRSLHRFCGRAQIYWSQSDVFDSLKPCYVMLTFETQIHRLEWFVQVILISVTPMLQNLSIGLKKRRNGKSDVPVTQCGSWPRISWNSWRNIKQHSSHLRKMVPDCVINPSTRGKSLL